MENLKNDYFIQNAVGITIIHLDIKKENENSDSSFMDYSLNCLLYYDKALNHVGALCLDTNDLQIMSCEKDINIKDLFNELALDIARLFMRKIESMINMNRIDEKKLFEKVDQKLWNRFNEIKQKTYIERLQENPIKISPSAKTEIYLEPAMAL